jgi:signal transduction histidine kinase
VLADLATNVALEERPQPSRTARDVGRLRDFIERYQQNWQVSESTLPDAIRFRSILERARRLPLMTEERNAVDAFVSTLARVERGAEAGAVPERYDIVQLREALGRLDDVNLEYMHVGYDDLARSLRTITILFIVVGVASMIAAPLFGWSVRRAIAPRVAILVEKVKRFRELGVNEPIESWGQDELSVLANALDVSFAAIAARDKERERFFAVAAHELKTPLTSLKGFAQVALTHRDDAAIRDRALTVIERQSTRLARLVQDLLWTASIEGGRLVFRPAPLDLEALARRAIVDGEAAAIGHHFPLDVHGDTHILGDGWLLEQSVTSLLIEAATMVPPGADVPVKLDAVNSVVRLAVDANGVDLPDASAERLMEPFAILQYESRREGEPRSTGLGLHLTREIAALHAASFRIERPEPRHVVFVMELRR